MRYAVLADFASSDASGKHTIVGIFDVVFDPAGLGPVAIPPCYLAAALQANMAEGSDHTLKIRLRRDRGTGADVLPPLSFPFKFGTSGPGQPLRANFNLGLAGLVLPSRGEYAFELFVDDRPLAKIDISAAAPPNAQGTGQQPVHG